MHGPINVKKKIENTITEFTSWDWTTPQTNPQTNPPGTVIDWTTPQTNPQTNPPGTVIDFTLRFVKRSSWMRAENAANTPQPSVTLILLVQAFGHLSHF